MGAKSAIREKTTNGYEKIMFKEKVPKKIKEKTAEYLDFCFKKNLMFNRDL